MNVSVSGTMGSGKSFITGMIKKNLDELNIPVIVLEADKIFKTDICTNRLFIQQAQKLTSGNAYTKNGGERVYNTEFFKENLFTDKQFYTDYNTLIEPFLTNVIINRLSSPVPLFNCIIELAVPSPSVMTLCDYNISVFTLDSTAHNRIKKRNPEYSDEYIKTVRSFQSSLNNGKLSDFYFDNCSNEITELDMDWCVGLFTGKSKTKSRY